MFFFKPANSTQAVRFAVVPLKAGVFPITVSAMDVDSGELWADVVTKPLYVEVVTFIYSKQNI